MKLTTSKPVRIDYLGEFYPEQEYELTEYQVDFYEHATGLKFEQENMPEGVTLSTAKKSTPKVAKPEEKQ